MSKKMWVLSAFFACFLITGCGKENQSGGTISPLFGDSLQSKISNAGIAKNWVRQSDGARLFISSVGSFSLTATSCGIIGTIETLNAFQQSECLSWVKACGTAYIKLTSGSNCPGYNTAGQEVVCTYQNLGPGSALGYELMLSCNGPMTDAQKFNSQ